jgi:hypothetical protein
MIVRIDKLAIELPMPATPSPNSASAVQELLGGKFGEMSTPRNYTFQSFNFRGRDKMKPFHDRIANIAAEEYDHIELVSHTINMLLSGSTTRAAILRRPPVSPRPTRETTITSLPVGKPRCHSIPWGNGRARDGRLSPRPRRHAHVAMPRRSRRCRAVMSASCCRFPTSAIRDSQRRRSTKQRDSTKSCTGGARTTIARSPRSGADRIRRTAPSFG